jgi:hypothetical protein
MDALRSEYLPISYLYSSRYGEGRTTVPVAPSQALYANFRYVTGIPAPEGVAGYSVDKLHILDVLIEQLKRVKNSSAEPIAEKSEGAIDALIQKYGDQIHELVSSSELPYSPASSIIQPGMLFSLAA